jgi:hypothetical protein
VHNARLHVEQAQRGWRIHPDSVPTMQSWLASAGELVKSLPRLKRERDELRSRGRPLTEVEWEELLQLDPLRLSITREREMVRSRQGQLAKARASLDSQELSEEEKTEAREILDVIPEELASAEGRLAELERHFHQVRWHFDDAALEASHERVARTVADLEDLSWPETGWIAKTVLAVRSAINLQNLSPEDQRSWDSARRAIANRDDYPLYEGLNIEPQIGLVPLRPLPCGLWEFWHVTSGERPQLDDSDRWRIAPETGIVLILVPRAVTHIGAQGTRPRDYNYDPNVREGEDKNPVREVQLDPYFLSTFELTQAQWERLAGDRPSTFCAGHNYQETLPIVATHPVESIGWQECVDHLQIWGLQLPTEAQWEFAARAGDPEAPEHFFTIEDIPPGSNLYQRTKADLTKDDPWFLHGPVDRMEESAWGSSGCSATSRSGPWIGRARRRLPRKKPSRPAREK